MALTVFKCSVIAFSRNPRTFPSVFSVRFVKGLFEDVEHFVQHHQHAVLTNTSSRDAADRAEKLTEIRDEEQRGEEPKCNQGTEGEQRQPTVQLGVRGAVKQLDTHSSILSL